ncbi:MAG: response regulator [Candidatus Omnitrophica bacterium]|nr:response regulator [Candidatus Omnitrophota bacterium]
MTIKKRILLIDDDHLVTLTLSRLLTNAGYEVIAVENGQEAIEKVTQMDFDLIISDVRMPGVDGVEVVEKIRTILKSSNRDLIPEIFITGFAEGNRHDQAKNMQASDLIYKPFDKDQFLASIQEHIKQ